MEEPTKKFIVIPVYFSYGDTGKIIIDFDSIREDYEREIKELQEKYPFVED
jgi:hypothetical protein